MVAKTVKAPSIIRQITDYIHTQIDDAGESVNLPLLVNDVLDHFGKDPRFVKQYWFYAAKMSVYEQARNIVAQSRVKAVFREDQRSTEEEPKSVFTRWWEHSGDRFYDLTEMTKEQVGLAIMERTKRIDTELRTVQFLQAIEGGLEDGEAVRDRYTLAELQSMAEEFGVKTG
jgi:hypothetical protein